jgi:glycopeptide antibiotics resistance protein
MKQSVRGLAAIAMTVYAALLGLALFWPSSGVQNQMIFWLMRRLFGLGIPFDVATFPRMEVLMNVAILMPLSLLGALVTDRLRWQEWTAYAFIASAVVEIVQGSLLPHRQASFSDIVANTTGAMLGAILGRLIVRTWGSNRDVSTFLRS